MTITALTGTADVRLTCMIQLTNGIGPDYSALGVSWLSPVSTEDGLSYCYDTENNSKVLINIPLVMKGQYCCMSFSDWELNYSIFLCECKDFR